MLTYKMAISSRKTLRCINYLLIREFQFLFYFIVTRLLKAIVRVVVIKIKFNSNISHSLRFKKKLHESM